MSHYETLDTTCCVAGGGPAGIMLGYLLARSGIRVTVLEKHKDFFRDFRGDTVHPSTMQVMHELGLLEDFLKLPHQEFGAVGGVVGDFGFEVADFRHLPARCKFVALMPQWDFLNFLCERARQFPTFDLRMQHEVVGLCCEGEQVTGVVARRGPDQDPLRIAADLVIGCDGRHSITRQAAQLPLLQFGVPIDVLWFRISRRPDDPERVLGTVNYGKALILIDRTDYFQAGLIIPKGSFDQIRSDGLDAFRNNIWHMAPFFGSRVDELRDWEQIQILTVQLNRLQTWHRPGLLCIGDAAHAMSPAGGVGINLAIQDAVAAANLLTRPLQRGRIREADLAKVQRRRELPTRITQSVQAFIHKGFELAFRDSGPLHAPWQLRVATRIPRIHRVLGYAVGIGVRPEHVKTAAPRTARKPAVLPARIGALVGATLGHAVVMLRKANRAYPARGIRRAA